MSNLAYLSLGSNIDPEANLPLCVALLAERCRVLAVSRVYETAPVGFAEQANFLNAAVLVEMDPSPVIALADVDQGNESTATDEVDGSELSVPCLQFGAPVVQKLAP